MHEISWLTSVVENWHDKINLKLWLLIQVYSWTSRNYNPIISAKCKSCFGPLIPHDINSLIKFQYTFHGVKYLRFFKLDIFARS